MPPKALMLIEGFITAAVAYPELKHIPDGENGVKDFTPVIEKALN